jgi:hypothetical protein
VDGILYKGRMDSQSGGRPLVTGEKDLTGKGHLGIPAVGPGSAGQGERMQVRPQTGAITKVIGFLIVCQAPYQVSGHSGQQKT